MYPDEARSEARPAGRKDGEAEEGDDDDNNDDVHDEHFVTYGRQAVLDAKGALRCHECDSAERALKLDADEDGSAYLYCEQCWGEFYEERFDGVRLSLTGERASTLGLAAQ